MVTHDYENDYHADDSVSSAKAGRSFDAITLYAEDFYQLSRLSPEQLHAWLTHWQCGFRPVAQQPT